MAKFNSLRPVLWTENLEETIGFYTQCLGFILLGENEDWQWASLKKDDVQIMLSRPNSHEKFNGIGFTGSFYFNVEKVDELYQILSPNSNDQGVWIHQNAWFHFGDLSEGWEGVYELKDKSNGVYFFVIEGDVTIAGQALNRRDGLGISETDSITIKTDSQTKLLVMEIPMSTN